MSLVISSNEYYDPVWLNGKHVEKFIIQLNQAMRTQFLEPSGQIFFHGCLYFAKSHPLLTDENVLQ